MAVASVDPSVPSQNNGRLGSDDPAVQLTADAVSVKESSPGRSPGHGQGR